MGEIFIHFTPPRGRQTPSIPRKGTETSKRTLYHLHQEVSQTPSIPRKGTETLFLGIFVLLPGVSLSDTLNSPQGDGNFGLSLLSRRFRGFVLCQTPSIPRKGTETNRVLLLLGLVLLESDTLNSPQGDGNGRENGVDYYLEPVLSDTLNSPQGDGNVTYFVTSVIVTI